jgi:hypothetical protein
MKISRQVAKAERDAIDTSELDRLLDTEIVKWKEDGWTVGYWML